MNLSQPAPQFARNSFNNEALSEWMKCGGGEARTTGVCFRK